MSAASGPSRALFWSLLLAALLLSVHGGARTPDTEIMFRTAESLAERGSWSVEPIESWPDFGLAQGEDGKLYSKFGPVVPLVLALPVRLAGALLDAGLWTPGPLDVPPSYYLDLGLLDFLKHRPIREPRRHALRFLVAFVYNPVVTLLLAMTFFALLRCLGVHEPARSGTTLLLVLGTPVWPYAGTYFSEPLATLLMLASLLLVVRIDPDLDATPGSTPEPDRGGRAPPTVAGLLGAGLLLGASAATHLSFLLFLPFLGIYTLYVLRRVAPRGWWRWLLVWLLGLLLCGLLLGLHNRDRFGDPFDTGRYRMPAIRANPIRFQAPGEGIHGLLVGSGKGLLLYCPAVLLGLLGLDAFFRRHRVLAAVIATCVLFRFGFNACLELWPGGFGLGPRLLFGAFPLMLLPVGPWLEEARRACRPAVFTTFRVVLLFLVLQQAYFCAGEIFSFQHMTRWVLEGSGVHPFEGRRMYLVWEHAPLYRLHMGVVGSYAARLVTGSVLAAWAVIGVPVTLGLAAWSYRSRDE